MSRPSYRRLGWVFAAGALAALAVLGSWSWMGRPASRHGVEPRSGFVMGEAERRKSRAYLSFMYALLYQDRGRTNEAAERLAEACALDRVLQPNLESDLNPS